MNTEFDEVVSLSEKNEVRLRAGAQIEAKMAPETTNTSVPPVPTTEKSMSSTSIWQRLKNRFFTGQQPDLEEAIKDCFWKVDIHSHLLPGVDDGVSSWEETLACLKQFSEWGITKVVTTPHVSRDWFPNKYHQLLEGQEQLQSLVREHNLPLTIEVAAEYLLDDFFLDLLKSREVLTFGPEKYILVETAWSSAPLHLSDLIFRIQSAGYTPILAHPERYKYYKNFEAELAHHREAGCLLQLNAMSLTGKYGEQARRQGKTLLQKGWVDFIGSDLHRPADLPRFEKIFSLPEFKQLTQQPLQNSKLL